ncbi:hypothetical protein THAOC_37648 [Thalassiosira oceanica]|uniref:Uncharacterized protein n=1 Tax=Thalassiosira oceanica TaxID=159749 RepID=K0R5L6_THAOC|nr:hypothetical protein THAOC_37648 [Thalassiosira oceanica]|eukprot:EJK43866.1 hypothetical protein THAOC_37648 [Thalassiosira oceanica]
MGCHARSRKTTHASTVTKVPTKTKKNEQNHGDPRARRIAPQPRASIERQFGNIESKLIDEFIPAASASSDLQIRTRTGGQPTEVPPRCCRGAAEEPSTDIGLDGGVDGPQWTRAMGAFIGPPGEAMEELDSPYRRCAGRADRDRQGAVL